jgi:uncharacterized protein (DUF433 family)
MTQYRKLKGRTKSRFVQQSTPNKARLLRPGAASKHQGRRAKLLGRYIVADPDICHGKPTFRGTRIMVWQVLEMVAEGMAWESIVEEWEDSITKEAIAEAVQLASKSFLKHAHEHALEPMAA